MRPKQLTILFTGMVPVASTLALAREVIPEARIVSIIDDSLLDDVIAAGELTRDVTRRLCQYALAAEDGGADLILSQCSSVSEAMDVARPLVRVPILKIDEPMAEEAARLGPRVVVAATLPTTLGPTSRLIERAATAVGRELCVTRVLAEGAFDVLKAGDATASQPHGARLLAPAPPGSGCCGPGAGLDVGGDPGPRRLGRAGAHQPAPWHGARRGDAARPLGVARATGRWS